MEKIKHLLCLIIGLIGLVSCTPAIGPVIVNGLNIEICTKKVYENGHTISGYLPSGVVLWAGNIEAKLISLTISRPDGEILFEVGTDQPSLLEEMNKQRPPFVLFVDDSGVRRISRKELGEHCMEQSKKKK